ncbi:MAG: phosphatidyl-myo-inositol dimannoside synthase [Blastocatellia bacterium]|nr:phosphatidyl-myo-inositol dimannoside synthase [Blastocatellia bacterium]
MILTLQTNTFGAYGGIPTYNRLVCRVLNEFGHGLQSRVLIGNDKPAEVEPRRDALPHLSLEGHGGNRKSLITSAIGHALRQPLDLALIGHVNYAPLGLALKRLQPALRYGVIIYGIDVWRRLSWIHRRALRDADFIISISEYTKRRAVDFNGQLNGRAYLLPNALEWDDAQPAATANASSSLPEGTRLLSVCRLDSSERYKGVDHVIESLPWVARNVPDVQYIVVGGGTDLARHQELAAAKGVADRVHFLGFVDEATLRDCYRNCELFVMPSAGEGFGFVFLEAMQYGKAVVAANSGGAPEVVQDNLTGSLVEYGNTEQLARVLTDLCLNTTERERLGEAGQRRLRERFTFPGFKAVLTDILTREMSAATLYKSRRRTIADMMRVV